MATDQAKMMEQILDFRRESDAFKESIRSRSADMAFKFYDGPPFTSGDPHYGHLLQSTVKDMVPRWMTMRGYRVERKRGWDCHGIPAENFVNKKLGITSRKQVEEEFGIKNYVEECRAMVSDVNDKRKRFVDHVGRWADMENAYFTMDNDFMESVIHLFSDLYDKNLIYKGFKVLGYSWALGTALSNSEIAEGYADRQDAAVTVKFRLSEGSEFLKKSEKSKFEMTEDGFIDVVSGVIRDGNKYCLIHHALSGNREGPGGKVEIGESLEDALAREVKEEFGIIMTGDTYLGNVKAIYCEKKYRFHYFDVTYTGVPQLLEKEKHHDLQRVEVLDDDNEIGFVVRVNGTIIDDINDLRKNFVTIYYTRYVLKKEKMIDNAPVFFLARTTTPWTLPANMFLAVNQDLWYVMIYDPAEKEYFVMAEDLLQNYYKNAEDYIFVYRIKGKELLGLHYEPLFDYYYKSSQIQTEYHSQVHRVMHADFVTADAGTGIAHEAPAFGEDDYRFVTSLQVKADEEKRKSDEKKSALYLFPADKAKDWLFSPVDDHGAYTDEVTEWAGVNVFEANKLVIRDLKDRGLLAKQETINHSYPHCPRTGEPIIYRAIESWFLKEKELSTKTVPSAEAINFVPEAIKKRFINGLASAPDWNISRTRFWGCPLPIWENQENHEEKLVPGSLEEIYQLNKPLKQITKIVLVRHGRTDYNEKRHLDHEGKARLTEQGEQQAKDLVKVLENEKIDIIYSSPLQRCKDMIAGVAKNHNLFIIEDERLRETFFPAFQDKSMTHVSEWNDEPIDGKNGESVKEVYNRVHDFMKDIVEKYPGKTIVIVSHSGPLKLIRKVFFDCDYKDTKKYKISNKPGNIPYKIDYIFSDSLHAVDFHRPYIDEIKLVHPDTGNTLQRIPEVLDCWFESGSMPYGQDHYMMKSDEESEVGGRKSISLNFYDQKTWEAIVNGTKMIETRALNPEEPERYFGDIKVGDVVIFVNKETENILQVKVNKIYIRDDFSVLWEDTSVHKKIYGDRKEKKNIKTLAQFKQGWNFREGYVEKIEKNGMIGFEFDLLEKSISPSSFNPTADFIAEGLDQTRGWFRALHVLGEAYMNQLVFKNVVVTGMVLAEDGKKMSKSKKNFPDPAKLLKQYGADAFRLYLLGSPIVRAEPLRFKEKGVEQILKDFVIPLENVANFFMTYAKVDGRKDEGTEVYFMRHALKVKLDEKRGSQIKKINDEKGNGAETFGDGETIENKNVPLSEEGFEQLKSKDFIERVLRIQPDIIVTSDYLRSVQTAQGAQQILKQYGEKEVDIIKRNDLLLGFNNDTAIGIYKDILNSYKGKKILIVSHSKRFEILRRKLFCMDLADSGKIPKKLQLVTTGIVKLPLQPIKNELDKRILAEVYKMLGEVDTALSGYEIESATKALMGFMDKLTNRYLRRSRRRFWAEGMDKDKQNAYATLREVLNMYLKVAAPFTPFVVEKIWLEMQVFQSGKLKAKSGKQHNKSIHLEYRPLYSDKYVDEGLVEEIAIVRKIIKGAMYLRSKNQIKVKQPLKELRFKI